MIEFSDFLKVEMHIGEICEVSDFPEARKPAYILKIDFGPEIGIKKSSAQITDKYQKSDLLKKRVVAVTNFPPKQIGPILSEVLVLGLSDADKTISLLCSDHSVPLGSRVH